MTTNGLTLQFQTTVLRVRNLAESRAWYERVLGMKIAYEDRLYKLISLTSEAGNRLTLWELAEGEVGDISSPSGIYPVFRSYDARGDYRALASRGVSVTEPQDDGGGLRYFWVTDPDGFRISVVQFLPE